MWLHKVMWPSRERQTLTVVQGLRVTYSIRQFMAWNLTIGRLTFAEVESIVVSYTIYDFCGSHTRFFCLHRFLRMLEGGPRIGLPTEPLVGSTP